MSATEHRVIQSDGLGQTQVKCPECGVWGDVDTDQFHGCVSLICPSCGWHDYCTAYSGLVAAEETRDG